MIRFGEIWVRRPVLWVLAAYIAGLAVSVYFHTIPIYICMAMVIPVAAALIAGRRVLFPSLLVLVVLFGCLRGTLFNIRQSTLKPYFGQRIELYGRIAGLPRIEPEKIECILHADTIVSDNQIFAVDEKVVLDIYPEEETDGIIPVYNAGDRLKITGVLKQPSGQRNPKCFDYGAYLKRRGIFSTISVANRSVSVMDNGKPFAASNLLPSLSKWAAALLDRTVGGREGALLKAMLLGQRWLVEPGVQDDFERSGLAHILSISGLHIGYIVLLLGWISSILHMRRWPALIFQAFILFVYCMMVGASASVVRSVVMAIVYLIGRALGRKTDTINTLGVAALAILLFKPMEILEVGFQMSFLTVCSIALFYKPLKTSLRFLPSRLSSGAAVTIAAQLGIFPLTAYYFNILSPAGLLVNLILIPASGLAVIGGFLIIPLGCIMPWAAQIAGLPVKWVCTAIIEISGFAADLPYAYLRVISPSIIALVTFYLIMWVLSPEKPGWVKRPYFTCGIIFMLFLSGMLIAKLAQPKELTVVFLDVGQGDCTYIRTPDDRHILIDGGGKEGMDTGEDVVVPFLLKNGINRLDAVIMSHSHYDHIGGLASVIRQIKTGCLIEYPPGEPNESYIALKAAASQSKVPVMQASKGMSYRIGKDVILHILYPDSTVAGPLSDGDENNYSLVFRLEYGDTSVLFTGDIGGAAERYVAEKMTEQSDILKIAHHGSNTSTSDAFLDNVSPEIVVIQVGSNIFGHPSPVTIDRLEDRDITVYRNDLQGAVICRYGNNGWEIETMVCLSD